MPSLATTITGSSVIPHSPMLLTLPFFLSDHCHKLLSTPVSHHLLSHTLPGFALALLSTQNQISSSTQTARIWSILAVAAVETLLKINRSLQSPATLNG